MASRLRHLLFDPAAFFDREPPALSRSAGVLVAIGVLCLGVVPPALSLLRSPVIPDSVVFDAFPPIRYVTAGWDVSVPGIVGLIAATLVAEPLIAWLAFTAVFYLLSWPVAGERGFGRTVRFVAWGFVPQFVANVVALVVLSLRFPATPTEIWSLGITVPARIYAFPPATDPLFVAANAAAVCCTVWSGFLWAHAVSAARGVSLRREAAVVVVPTVLVLGPI
ncbi:YIP1 family protein [Natrinema caseinilyticum]|uniref:YIP1 family protein n=1 Tax=Natrinema caseinilyticum TaxID=2961570 RepID=UPI0020C3769E|nr:YIP1 family protein [Natrinema caseinilyticum]